VARGRELPRACFGFEVTSDGWVIQAAPTAAWTIGRRGRAVVHYYRQRGGRAGWQQVPHRPSYAGHPLTGTAEELHAAVNQLLADGLVGPNQRGAGAWAISICQRRTRAKNPRMSSTSRSGAWWAA
jgi:hypothetical protein